MEEKKGQNEKVSSLSIVYKTKLNEEKKTRSRLNLERRRKKRKKTRSLKEERRKNSSET